MQHLAQTAAALQFDLVTEKKLKKNIHQIGKKTIYLLPRVWFAGQRRPKSSNPISEPNIFVWFTSQICVVRHQMLHVALVRSAIMQHRFTPRKTMDDLMQEQLSCRIN
jgi:hypothetical protein